MSQIIEKSDKTEALGQFLAQISNNNNLNDNLLELIENLNNDLEANKKTISILQDLNSTLSSQGNHLIASKYWNLKSEYVELQMQNEHLKSINDDLSIQIVAKNEEMKRILSEKQDEWNECYTQKMKKLENEQKLAKESYEKRIEELYNEMQAAEAASALELDQTEFNLKRQLNESNKKIKEYMETCSVLRTELMQLKQHISEYKTETTQKISNLRQRLQTQDKQLTETQPQTVSKYDERALDLNTNDIVTIENSVIETPSSKYQALEVNYNNSSMITDNKTEQKRPPPVFRGKPYPDNNPKTIKRNTTIPPLIKLSESAKKVSGKKRRLYNPEDLSYLERNISNEKL